MVRQSGLFTRIVSVVMMLVFGGSFVAVPQRALADASPGYARFCKAMSPDNPEGSKFRDRQIADAQKALTGLPDAEVERDVEQKLKLAAPPVMIARKFDDLVRITTGDGPIEERYLLAKLDVGEPHYWVATMSPLGSVESIVTANQRTVQSAIAYPRQIAAYTVLNDLLGADDPFPRAGCAALFAAEFAAYPGVVPVLQAAVAAPPAQDAKLRADIRAAWNALAPDAPGYTGYRGGAALMSETHRRIGNDPPVTIVYADPGLPGDGIGGIDIVRIGGTTHTYTIVFDSGPVSLKGSILCVVGDQRCSKYYSWP